MMMIQQPTTGGPKKAEEEFCKNIVTTQDVDNNMVIYASLFRQTKADPTKTEEERIIFEMSFHGSTDTFHIKHSDSIKVSESKVHGSGVFATKAIPANVVVSFYPVDAVHNTHTGYVTIYNRDDGLDLVVGSDFLTQVANDYTFRLDPKRNLSIIANPQRRTKNTLLGHLINDGATDVFAGTCVTQLCKKPALLHRLILQYLKETTTYRNCRFHPTANRRLISIVTTRAIEPGEELFVSYGTTYWFEHHYGFDYDKKYPLIDLHLKRVPLDIYTQIQSYGLL